MSITRREFAAAAVLFGLVSASDNLFAKMLEVRSVPFGVHTFSFHEITEGGMPAVDEILADICRLGLNSIELYAPQLSPFPMPEGFYKRWGRPLIPPTRQSLRLQPRCSSCVGRSCCSGA